MPQSGARGSVPAEDAVAHVAVSDCEAQVERVAPLSDRFPVRFGVLRDHSRRIGEIVVADRLVTVGAVAEGPSGPLHAVEQSDEPVPASGSDRLMRKRRNVLAGVLFVAAMTGVAIVAVASGGGGSWYGLGALVVLTVKFVGSGRYRPVTTEPPAGIRVSVVACLYNEDPEAFRRCLTSITCQSRRPDEIWVIDDGSRDDACRRMANELLADQPGVVVHGFVRNKGKRYAQQYAFERTSCDIVVTIDSDTELEENAIAEGIRPFADPKVQAVTGNVRALNLNTNLLTHLIDLRYANAFLLERAAYSTVGAVVCCCGSLSFYRTEMVRRHLADFIGQSFLGVPVQFGDDRRMTQYALQSGRVVLQDTSVAYTIVPERIDHFRRQQLRWNKSFFRESLWALRHASVRRWPFWISLAELTMWITFSASLISTVYIRQASTGELLPWQYLAYAVLLAYARNVRYFGRPRSTVRSQITTFALAPIYTMMHVFLLTPLRIYALLTLRRGQWGTRANVEVQI
jgi:hyaluronan synthase